ncbi:hypothetical protein G6L30_08005 [Agrobacterium rhizogenes]|nr:hypothetical protein [Rhizobium rhizogenes]
MSGQKQIASFSWNDTSPYFPTKEESHANARLIAAALDLHEQGRKLAAEVGALRAFEHDIRVAIGNTNWSVLIDRLVGMDAAIAKAEGRS